MKIQKTKIAEKLKSVKNIIPTKTIGGVMGTLVKNGKLIAVNQELTIFADIGVETGDPFIIPQSAIPLIESLPNDNIEFKTGDKFITVKGGKSSAKFAALNVKEFEAQITVKDEASQAISYNGKQIKQAVNSVLLACDTRIPQVHMRGVLFQCDGKKNELNIVATDGHRMSWAKLPCKAQKLNMIIPKEALQKVISLVNDSDDVTIATSGTKAKISTGDYEIYTQLYEGNFLDYKKVFKNCKDSEIDIVVSRADIMDCVNRCQMCKDSSIVTPAVMELTDNNLLVLSMRTTTVDFCEEINVEINSIGKMRVGVNTALLNDTLKSCNQDMVTIHYVGANKPLIFDDNNTDLKHMLMPMRLKG